MHLCPHALLLLPLCITSALADFLGPTYPAPIDLTSDKSLIPASWKNLTSIFDAYLKGNHSTELDPLSGVEKVTFSVGLFSIHDPAAGKLQYHYTSPEIANSSQGTTQVDGDSIYKIASVSKLFTVFAGLLELTNEDWNRPLTDVIPGLADFAARETTGEEVNHVYRIQWDKITPWALAAQLGGVPALGLANADFLFVYDYLVFKGVGVYGKNPVTTYGFPPLNVSELGPCWDIKYRHSNDGTLYCLADEFVLTERSKTPSFLPWTSPAYSDDGFILLGIAISNMTGGKSMATIYRESIFEPLGLTSSSSSVPTGKAELARSVIPGDLNTSLFGLDGGVTTPSGGLFSTINDLAKFGIGILNSTLFPADLTRKWMKPITHTASLSHSVGAPWEIARYIHPSTGKVTDLYTKQGDAGAYGGFLMLIPDYNAGFSLLDANSNETLRSDMGMLLIDYVTQVVLPALEAQAAAEAVRNFVGEYVSTDSNVNSSVYLNNNESSGLIISSWISNGTDVLASSLFQGVKPRLLPSIPNQADNTAVGGGGKVAFQVSGIPKSNSYDTLVQTDSGILGVFKGQYANNMDWIRVGQQFNGGNAVKLFVFDVDEEGNATALSPVVTRAKLQRKG